MEKYFKTRPLPIQGQMFVTPEKSEVLQRNLFKYGWVWRDDRTSEVKELKRASIIWYNAGAIVFGMDYPRDEKEFPVVKFEDYYISESELTGLPVISQGASLISEERERHFTEEGWTIKDDIAYNSPYKLIHAAICYATPADDRALNHDESMPYNWPFKPSWWRPTPNDRVKELVKAGALIAAQIDVELVLEAKAKKVV